MINNLFSFFKKLKRNEKILILLFCAFIGFNIYVNFIYKPITRGIKQYRKETQKLDKRLAEVKSNFPDTEKGKNRIELLKEESRNYSDQIDEIQENLPSKENIPQLLVGFSRQAKDVSIISLRQKMDENKEYSRIFIEVVIDASHKATVNYIRRIESITPFLKIEEIELWGASKGAKEGTGRMVFSSLLKESPSAKLLFPSEVTELDSESRDIFTSKSKKTSQEQKKELKLEGITYNVDNPTAIINGEVVKQNSRINGYEVMQIFPEQVIINDGAQDYTLEITR
ncbi:MAG: type 4a pilus biogenesis protein PilO [Candidatus Omnitrophota bacterium]